MQKKTNNSIAICGAGIAGVATAYYLKKSDPSAQIVIIDKQQPLSFTTSKSGENFRDFWPQKSMQQLSTHSIRLMQELEETFEDTHFKMNYSGYNFVTKKSEVTIFSDRTDGSASMIDNILAEEIASKHPYLSKEVKRITTIKNAGNIDVHAMGSLLLREAKKFGTEEITGEIVAIQTKKSCYEIILEDKRKIKANKVIIAAGPFMNHLAGMIGLTFPIINTLQRKFVIPDPKKVIPRNMPFTIFADSQYLNWVEEEREFFRVEPQFSWLLDEFPAGLHVKPEGMGIKLGWAFNRRNEVPKWETTVSEYFPQVVLKGASTFIPQLAIYEKDIPTPLVEYAGYYTRTKENLPLVGSTDAPNVYVVGALSGFGTMTACAVGQLCSKYVLEDNDLPEYAPYFHPNRYQNQDLLKELDELISDGQL